MRFGLLNLPGDKVKVVKRKSSSLALLWLLLCLLAPFSLWFVMIGIAGYLASVLIPALRTKTQVRIFDREFPEFLVYFRIAAASTDPYQAIAVARNIVEDPLLKEKTGELARSLMLGVTDIDPRGTSPGFEQFISLLSNQQKIGLGLSETIEKLSSLTEERYFLRLKEEIRSRPVTHTWVRMGTTAGLLLYMYYPIIVTLLKGLLFQ